MTSEKFLKGRVAMITGGATGIGRSIALALADVGADVVIGSLKAVERPIKDEIEERGVQALSVNVDVGKKELVNAFYEKAVDEFGKVDILVNSAGIAPKYLITDLPDELWQRTMDVNLSGAYYTIKYCLPGMIERQWGRIINIASTSASVGAPGFGAYSASKAGLVGLSKCVALEGAPYGVTCNAISPGWVETDLALSVIRKLAETAGQSFEEYFEAIKQSNPQKRMIQPQEIGALAVFLCRDEALGFTMQDIIVSAGSLW